MKHRKPQHQLSVTPEATTPPCADAPGADLLAADFERAHVREVYDDIAAHFSATRHTAWPLVTAFVREQTNPSTDVDEPVLLLDVGCGNGKYLRGHDVTADGGGGYALGVDTCEHLVRHFNLNTNTNADDPSGDENIRNNNNSTNSNSNSRSSDGTTTVDVGVADVMTLPLRDNTFDVVLCIAVVHHLCMRPRRVAALRECVRVLRPHGKALFYVWAQSHGHRSNTTTNKNNNDRDEDSDGEKERKTTSKMMRRQFCAQDMLVPWHLRKRKDGADNDRILGDWHRVYRRFYHVYQQGELEDELCDVGGIEIVKSYFDHQNWCVMVRKLAPTSGSGASQADT